MGLGDLFSTKTPLQRALRRGTRWLGDLEKQLSKLGNRTIRSEAEAHDVCVAIRRVLTRKRASVGGPEAKEAILRLCTDVDPESPAVEILREWGIPIVLVALDDSFRDATLLTPYEQMLALVAVVLFEPLAGAETVVIAVRERIAPTEACWQRIFESYSDDSPDLELLFRELRDCLPMEFAEVALLDRANTARQNGVALVHPFDSAVGMERLEFLLRREDPELYSYASSAANALPFLSGPKRDELLAIALAHPHYDVRLRSIYAAACLGRDDGFEALAQACLDIRVAERARLYLEKLGREDLIPAEAKEAGFKARANFAEWLADHRELGHPPDEVEIVDHRELNWPPERKLIPVWLLRYHAPNLPWLKGEATGQEEDDASNNEGAAADRDEARTNVEDGPDAEAADDDNDDDDYDPTTDVGFVGSMTFCMFMYGVGQRPPEDGYAMHCFLELEGSDLISESYVFDDSSADRNLGYDHLLHECPIAGIKLTRVLRVAEFSEVLQYPGKLVVLASGTCDGEKGWFVFDGPRSRWYAKSEVPVDYAPLIMMVHVGRVLLGFTDEPDRRKYLVPRPME